jgi:endonuclease YncB( thermonuclease family)
VDTPEIRGKCDTEKKLAYKARDFTANKLMNAESIQLYNLKRGKYFRIIADISIDRINLANEIIEEKLGTQYNGREDKKEWYQ